MKAEHAKQFGFVLLALVLIGALTVIFNNPDPSLTGNVVFNPQLVEDCSLENVQNTWDSLFCNGF